LVANFILYSGKSPDAVSYYAFAFRTTHDMIFQFISLLDDRRKFTYAMVQGFIGGYSNHKSLKIEIDWKYREIEKELFAVLAEYSFYHRQNLQKPFNDLYVEIETLIKKLEFIHVNNIRITQLLSDLAHMQVNRIFVKQQLDQELVIYHCLTKCYESISARMAKQIYTVLWPF